MREKAEQKYFQGGELTAHTLTSGEKRQPLRPLGEFSNFVVEALPAVLVQLQQKSRAREDVGRTVEKYAAKLLSTKLPTVGTQAYALGRLDVMMVYAGLAHSGVRVGEQYSHLIEYFSQTDLPTLTYEDIVMLNPISDPRTFTDGKVGSDEASFYQLHQELERPMDPLVESVRKFVGGKVSSSEVAGHISALDVLFANTRASGRGMQYFDGFREYLNGIPENMLAPTLEQKSYGGPSGAYSPTVHELDLLACGVENQYDEVALYVKNHLQYFPSASRKDLLASVDTAKNHNSLIDSVRSSGYELAITVLTHALLSKLLIFRSAHLAAVARQVPQLFQDKEAAGTGGIPASVAFLRRRLERVKTLKAELEIHLPQPTRRSI